MTYQSLYREWRPGTFSEVYGQEHIKKTLSNMLEHQRVPHALLFCGPRGTGKTTMAKILAKAVNCKEGVSPTPCLVCGSCTGITNNSSIDVLEIDAASNRGIDEIRQLREQVKYTPTESRYKVYIIDEVHMLTTEAFNALLKTLEEPPAHVIFILATTEPHKLPLTIISRCQRFDFRRLTPALIQARLREVAQAKAVDIAPEAALHIAQLAEGGMRDALGMLEQSISYGEGKVTLDVVEQVTGSVPLHIFLRLLQLMSGGDEASALLFLSQELDAGREANQFLASYLSALRRMLLAVHSPELLIKAGFDKDTVEKVVAVGRGLRQVLPELTELALVAEGDMKYGGHPQLYLELLVVKQLALIQGKTVVQSKQVQTAKPITVVATPQPAVKEPEAQVREDVSSSSGPQVAKLLKAWPEVIKVIRAKAPLTASTLGVVSPQRLEGGTVILQMMESNPHTYKRLQGDLEQIRLGLSAVLGQDVQVKLVMNDDTSKAPDPEIDQVKEALDLFKGKIVKDK